MFQNPILSHPFFCLHHGSAPSAWLQGAGRGNLPARDTRTLEPCSQTGHVVTRHAVTCKSEGGDKEDVQQEPTALLPQVAVVFSCPLQPGSSVTADSIGTEPHPMFLEQCFSLWSLSRFPWRSTLGQQMGAQGSDTAASYCHELLLLIKELRLQCSFVCRCSSFQHNVHSK